MSNERQETIADIVAWIRRHASVYGYDLADRIETAYERERKPSRNFNRFTTAADAIDEFQDKHDNELIYINAWNEFACWLYSAPDAEKEGGAK